MTTAEFDLYRTEGFIAAVEANLGRDPGKIALDKRLPYARELATRVKYLQKAEAKLPAFYRARCIIPPRAYEQSTSEAVASEKRYRGKLCLDLTCGLGVDSFAMSKNFEKVITLERDILLAEITRYNFLLLGAKNIEVVNCTAEEYLAGNPDIKPDLVYADPDRRDGTGKRVSALGDCSPDIGALMPLLRKITGKTVVKLSPLFDIHEAFRIFGGGTTVTVISHGGECKEVLAETGCPERRIAARITGEGEISYPFNSTEECPVPTVEAFMSAPYLAVPDVALTKSETAVRYYASHGWGMTSRRGFAYGDRPFPSFGSRVYRIAGIEPYNPRQMKKILKAKDISRLTLLNRDFPLSNTQVCKQLGIREGSSGLAALLTVAGKPYFVFLEDITGPDL